MILTTTIFITFIAFATLVLPFLGIVTLMLTLSSSRVDSIIRGGDIENENNLWS